MHDILLLWSLLSCQNADNFKFCVLFSFAQEDHIITHVNTQKKLVTHFFAKEVSYESYCEIERTTLQAKEWEVEVHVHVVTRV